MKTEQASTARFTRKIVFFDEPQVAEHLADLAVESGTSSSSLCRMALRQLIARVDPAVPSRGR